MFTLSNSTTSYGPFETEDEAATFYRYLRDCWPITHDAVQADGGELVVFRMLDPRPYLARRPS